MVANTPDPMITAFWHLSRAITLSGIGIQAGAIIFRADRIRQAIDAQVTLLRDHQRQNAV